MSDVPANGNYRILQATNGANCWIGARIYHDSPSAQFYDAPDISLVRLTKYTS